MCSLAEYWNQFWRPQAYSYWGATPGGANQLARSHPKAVPKQAPCLASLSWRTGSCATERAVTGWRKGKVVSVEEPHGFGDPVSEVAGVILPTGDAPDVDFPEVFGGVSFGDPFGEGPTGSGRACRSPGNSCLRPRRSSSLRGLLRACTRRRAVKLSGTTVRCLISAFSSAGTRRMPLFGKNLEVVPVLLEFVELEVLGLCLSCPRAWRWVRTRP